ncbi:MAG: hypothetical protein ACK4GN_02595 [Runella sp.]
MLTLYTANQEVNQIINAEFRLNEVVYVKDLKELANETPQQHLLIDDEYIKIPIVWTNEVPPYLLPYPIRFTSDNLLAVVYTKLNNYEKAYQYAQSNQPLLKEIDTLNCLQYGVAIALPELPQYFENSFEEYRFWHNRAILAHYGETTHFIHYAAIRRYYERAFDLAPNDEWKAFTGKHWATLLLDAEELTQANQLLSQCIEKAISDEAKIELTNVQYAVWLKQLTAPYDPNLLEKTKKALWEVLQHYEKTNNKVQTALLLIDASQVANFSDSFTESLGYINRAIELLQQEQMPELVANAQYRKGTLLFTWAQNGNPQFYRPAIDAYQQAVKVFTKENAPETFAEIQHHLGVIYSEIPDEVKKKSVWAAVSVSSFKEALSYFTRETHPYEYARICNHYANALTKFPDAKLTDNYTKALEFYREALLIRTADEYPYERALTILNFLEAAWQVSVTEPMHQQALFEEMNKLAKEIASLVNDEKLIAEAYRHLDLLQELKERLD